MNEAGFSREGLQRTGRPWVWNRRSLSSVVFLANAGTGGSSPWRDTRSCSSSLRSAIRFGFGRRGGTEALHSLHVTSGTGQHARQGGGGLKKRDAKSADFAKVKIAKKNNHKKNSVCAPPHLSTAQAQRRAAQHDPQQPPYGAGSIWKPSGDEP